ncbi:cytochrome c1 [Moniliophthora roreri]|nr:cytochrome c1 [Moniliophthora roreri]
MYTPDLTLFTQPLLSLSLLFLTQCWSVTFLGLCCGATKSLPEALQVARKGAMDVFDDSEEGSSCVNPYASFMPPSGLPCPIIIQNEIFE